MPKAKKEQQPPAPEPAQMSALKASHKPKAKDTRLPNELYFGDCLNVLRDSIKSEFVDLIYLDPPFNSNATYNAPVQVPERSTVARSN